ncbi:RsmB/NOP family class I SAM-dependent RNA methyltransferase [Desulfohalovibrio reitneri]|uniref:RsmB/NOP family class I SAM-dependent RNA methyltransferase n=1 Tax=Desulfohalovibrio reitneri TaxID=1307759 RepID=UPI0004A6C08F|nr:RsmB/NOP family class I SAM-dependent RNA methyltransferase [Desulfohalovibrio reitneri]
MSGRSFRLECPENQAPAVLDLLAAEGFVSRPDPVHPLARVLTEEPAPLGESTAARAGLVYIQDRSSMLPPLLLDPPPGAAVADLCAAPGSKTSLLARLVGWEGFVLGNEPNPQRLGTLRANLRRLNLANTATCSWPGERIPLIEGGWGHLLLDPPCSGWGTEDRHPGIREKWSGERTSGLLSLQRALLDHAATLLAPGGRLLYSTCTTNPEENGEQTARAAGEHELEILPLRLPEGFRAEADAAGGLTVDATGSGAQGFYLCLLAKRGESPYVSTPPSDDIPGEPVDPAELAEGLHPAPAWENLPPGEVRLFKGRVLFLHRKALALPRALRWQGFPLGRLDKRGRFRPEPKTALLLPPYAPEHGLNIDDSEALRGLLQGQSLRAPGEGRGVWWRKIPLGWLSRKGKRVLWAR